MNPDEVIRDLLPEWDRHTADDVRIQLLVDIAAWRLDRFLPFLPISQPEFPSGSSPMELLIVYSMEQDPEIETERDTVREELDGLPCSISVVHHYASSGGMRVRRQAFVVEVAYGSRRATYQIACPLLLKKDVEGLEDLGYR